jgi:hypothetical protein
MRLLTHQFFLLPAPGSLSQRSKLPGWRDQPLAAALKGMPICCEGARRGLPLLSNAQNLGGQAQKIF